MLKLENKFKNSPQVETKKGTFISIKFEKETDTATTVDAHQHGYHTFVTFRNALVGVYY